jgi:hypothetical protein
MTETPEPLHDDQVAVHKAVPFDASPEAAKARRIRSIALAVALGVFVVIVFFVTLARMGGHVADPHF